MNEWLTGLKEKFKLKQHHCAALRALVAIDLIKRHDFLQTEVANRLGVKQATVSYYLSETHGKESFTFRKNKELMAEIHKIADSIAGVKTDE